MTIARVGPLASAVVPAAPCPHRPRSLRDALLALLAAGLVVVAAACATPTPKTDQLSTALVDSGLSKPVAHCTAAALTSSLSPGELRQIADRGAGGAPVDDPAKKDEPADKLTAAMAKCRALLDSTPTTTTSATSSTVPSTEPAPGGSSTSVAPGASLVPGSG